MSFESQMTQGYPTEAEIDAFLSDLKLELVTENNPNYYPEQKQFTWGILMALKWVLPMSVYCPSSATFNVRGGKYLWKDQVKEYTPGSAINPTDNDTTYIWLKPDNTIGYDIDGNGWPTTEHVRLAEIDVDSDGKITEIRDLRSQAFLQYLAKYVIESGSSIEIPICHWDSSSPADNDEIRLPIYAENDASEKTEFARLTVKLTDVSDGDEDAQVLLSKMIAGTLTSIGELVGSESIKEKSISLLASVSVDLNAVAFTNMYTVPTGKKLIVDHIKIRNLSASAGSTVCTFGQSTDKDDFVGAQTLSNLDAAGKAAKIQPIPSATPAAIIEYAAAAIFGIDVTTAAGSACTVIAELKGHLVNA